MKDFYQFISESNDNLYYEIDVIKWRNNTINTEYVENEFIKKIKHFLTSIGFKIDYDIPKDNKSIYLYTSFDHEYLILRQVSHSINICITKDEWYYVKRGGGLLGKQNFYKCDQYDGLIKCLTDILK